MAYDVRTGEIRWQTFTIADEPIPQGVNAAGTQNHGPSGAPIWNSPAIDIERSQLLVGTGENYSSPPDGASDAIFAIDLATGAVNWIFQATAGDAWNMACGPWDRTNCPVEDGPDYDFGAGTVFAQDADGRDLVVAGQKSGVVHALDAYTGKPVWQTKVGRGGIHGGVYFGMAAAGGRLFVPISDTDDGCEYPEPPRPCRRWLVSKRERSVLSGRIRQRVVGAEVPVIAFVVGDREGVGTVLGVDDRLHHPGTGGPAAFEQFIDLRGRLGGEAQGTVPVRQVVDVALHVSEHDQRTAPGELCMFDLTVVVAHDEMLGEPEGVREPAYCLVGVFVTKGRNQGLVAGHLDGSRSRRAAC